MQNYNQGFPGRMTNGGFNNSLLFVNNRLLFSLSFSVNFVGGQGLDGGGQSRDSDRGNPQSPH